MFVANNVISVRGDSGWRSGCSTRMGSVTAHPSQIPEGELRLGHEDEVDPPHLAGRRQEHAEQVVEPASRQVYSVNSTLCRG